MLELGIFLFGFVCGVATLYLPIRQIKVIVASIDERYTRLATLIAEWQRKL